MKFLSRAFATIANLPFAIPSTTTNSLKKTMQSPILPRINIFGSELVKAPTGEGPTTGFFRNSYCDASKLDPASHTVAAIITPEFLTYSKSVGNDLTSLFPTSGPYAPKSEGSQCVWCLCATRWLQSLHASPTHSLGEKIVPKVYLESSHIEALRQVPRGELERFGVGGVGAGEEGGVCENPGEGGLGGTGGGKERAGR